MTVGDSFAGIEAFYGADERLRRSGEVDYGVLMWRDGGRLRTTQRVSLVEATGEVYAVELGYPGEAVEILAERLSAAVCEELLAGWEDQSDLDWVRRQLRPLAVGAGFCGYAANPGEHRVWVVEDGRRVARLESSEDGRRSSPGGFAWGYGGSGPFALAHSILVHRSGGVEVPRSLGQRFKFEVVAGVAADEAFAVSFARVDAWVAGAGR